MIIIILSGIDKSHFGMFSMRFRWQDHRIIGGKITRLQEGKNNGRNKNN
jgi:hypothetical protein